MSQQEPPKIEFPCRYPIRVMGEAHGDFIDKVYEIVNQHAPDIDRASMKTRDSRQGRFISVHFVIEAQSVAQLECIHVSLKAYSAVKMVL